MACESTHLILVLTSCPANSSISNFLFWCSPKPSLNNTLTLQLVPPPPPPHQVSNSVLASRESFAQSDFLLHHFLSNLSVAMFQIYYHSLFSFNITHYPSTTLIAWPFGSLSPISIEVSLLFQSSPPRSRLPSFQGDEWLFSRLILTACSAFLPPSPNARSPLASPGRGLDPTSTSSACTLVLREHVWQGSPC